MHETELEAWSHLETEESGRRRTKLLFHTNSKMTFENLICLDSDREIMEKTVSSVI